MQKFIEILGFTLAGTAAGILVFVCFGLPALKIASPYISYGFIGLYIVLRILPKTIAQYRSRK